MEEGRLQAQRHLVVCSGLQGLRVTFLASRALDPVQRLDGRHSHGGPLRPDHHCLRMFTCLKTPAPGLTPREIRVWQLNTYPGDHDLHTVHKAGTARELPCQYLTPTRAERHPGCADFHYLPSQLGPLWISSSLSPQGPFPGLSLGPGNPWVAVFLLQLSFTSH